MLKYTVIDFFSGAGGLSKGFLDAYYDIILGVDWDDDALITFQKNHINSKALKLDLFDVNNLQIIVDYINQLHTTVDVIVGGPPCQGFSLTGPRKFDDPRNQLYLSLLEAVKLIQPKAFVIENVAGMATLYNGQIKDEIIKRFSQLGYNVTYSILCAADFGIPQIRKRLFFVGLKQEYGIFKFPKPIIDKNNYITCEDAISDLPSLENSPGIDVGTYCNEPITDYQKLMRNDSKILYNHVATKHSEYVKSVISLVPDGGNYKDLPQGVGSSRKFNEAWTRYNSKKPSKTIDTGHRNHFHYKYNRVPTVRENARLQSFPDNFIFYGSKTQQNKQVGNAVPPLLGYYIGLELKKYLKGKYNG